jgi:glyoxylase-like metal-dependent hydrolase (beta-lactamase superfamily II)
MDSALSPLPAPLSRVDEMDKAWTETSPGQRLEAVRRAGRVLRQRVLSTGRVVSVRTFPVAIFPYPSEYGLAGAARSPAPYVMMRNATQLVQVEDDGGRLVNVLVNPTDAQRSLEAPFFAKQIERYGKFVTQRVLSKSFAGSAEALAEVGIEPAEIDYITFDHLHTQDVRGLLGTTEPEPGKSEPTPPLYPNAVLLVQRAELRTLECLHPLQARWYVRDGIRAVPRDRIAVLEGDYMVGRGLALVRTPGHTEGNHSIVIHTETGLWTVSENGVAVECYAPLSSEIGGVRRHARETETEFILNSNTRENSLDQYISMALEKTLADPSTERPEFPQCFPSSEMVKSRLAPGLRPTFSHGRITHGEVRSRIRRGSDRADKTASSAA